MGTSNAELAQVSTSLTSFSGNIVEPLGEVVLPMSLDSYPRLVTKMVKFLVVDTPSTYNVILGRPSLNFFQAIVSTYHLKLKFPTADSIKEEIGDRRHARACYATSLRKGPNGKHMKQPTKGENLNKEKKTLVTTHIILKEAPTKENNEGEPNETKKGRSMKSV
ncbi:UNVERIFIED_CONTAM: hypothetical protein Slati_2506800 [Sesamum latifolium]|uniref:Uncharacterized protein n=1 Tax=Sesamum latifolium TaxID=2727402 RepID=A0AAW2WFR8_9LAMI